MGPEEPDLQGRLDAAEEASRVLGDRCIELSSALSEVQALAADGDSGPEVRLGRIEAICAVALWTGTANARDEGAGW